MTVFSLTQFVGMCGVILSAIAYLPQIIHLIREHCSAGISRKAYFLWCTAAIAILISSLTSRSLVFVLLALTQVIADILILIFSYKYKGTCGYHAEEAQRTRIS